MLKCLPMSRRALAPLVLAGLAGAAGCVVDRHAEPALVTEPRTCSADLVLASDGAPAMLPLALDATGATVCLHLDATRAVGAAHFVASTAPVPGESSGLVAVLQDTERGTLQDGWDVTPEDDDAVRTYANLEWNAPVRELTEAVLWLRAPQPPVAATLQLALFEPGE
jgi:hypothetical protein